MLGLLQNAAAQRTLKSEKRKEVVFSYENDLNKSRRDTYSLHFSLFYLHSGGVANICNTPGVFWTKTATTANYSQFLEILLKCEKNLDFYGRGMYTVHWE